MVLALKITTFCRDEENEAHVGPLNKFRRMQILRNKVNNDNEVEASTNTTMTSSTTLLPSIESANEIMGMVEHSRNKRATIQDGCFTSENELKRAHIWINFTVMFLLPVLVSFAAVIQSCLQNELVIHGLPVLILGETSFCIINRKQHHLNCNFCEIHFINAVALTRRQQQDLAAACP